MSMQQNSGALVQSRQDTLQNALRRSASIPVMAVDCPITDDIAKASRNPTYTLTVTAIGRTEPRLRVWLTTDLAFDFRVR